MRIPLIYKIAAPIVLVVFVITSCNIFTMPEPPFIEPVIPPPEEMLSVPIGEGDIQFVYLDEDYRPTINDIGKMALYVENNELAQGVMVLSEIRDNNIYNDVVVRVINKQNDSLVSMFYHSGKNFPYRIAISADGEDITGVFSSYNPLTETYSVEFSNGDGESELFKDLVLNNNVFSLHEDNDELTETQNVRLRDIIISLALWNSMAFQIDNDFSVNARGLFNLKKLLKIVLCVVAVVAVVAVVILAPPAAVVVAGPVITVAVTTVPQVIAAGIAIAAAAAAVLVDLLPDDVGKGPQKLPEPSPPPPLLPPIEEPDPSEPEYQYPKIEVTLNGKKIGNNQIPPYYLEPGKSLTFAVKAVYLPTGVEAKDLIDESKLSTIIYAFDPENEEYIEINPGVTSEVALTDALFYNVSTTGSINDVLQITVTRKQIGRVGNDGRIHFIIVFRQFVTLNDDESGVLFWDKGVVTLQKHIFILNFTD